MAADKRRCGNQSHSIMVTDTQWSPLCHKFIEPIHRTNKTMAPSASPTTSTEHQEGPPKMDIKPTEGIRKRSQSIPDWSQDILIVEEIKALKSHIHPPVPNPAPLGLIAFGLTTALLQIKHTRIGGDSDEDLDGVDTVVMGFAMFFGGLLQIIAGLSEIRRNNIFGYTAFSLYGGFWMSVGTVEIVSLLATGEKPPINAAALHAMYFMVGVFTFMLWVLTFKMNKTINSLFFLLGSTLMLLCAGVHYETADIVGGYFGLATSINAFWLAFAELVNDVIGEGREIIPLGHWNAKMKDHGAAHVSGRTQGRRPTIFGPNAGATQAPEKSEGLEDIEEGRTTTEENSGMMQ
jgi:succinate-acetate transporter protein